MSAPEPRQLHELLDTLGQVVQDRRVLAAIRSVPRPLFVPPELRGRAWENTALPIGYEQTISQPMVVARMLELLALSGSERVLDVGTGSGYHAALLARLSGSVISIERHAELSHRAAAALAAAGIDNVELVVGDGSVGLPERGPFDAINVAAAGTLETLQALAPQLATCGRIVAPLAEDPDRAQTQCLVVIRAGRDGTSSERWEPVRFVPLVSERTD
ncbi:MAG TPA: protein-L-isoaspartate(D-aspartate) O-methyltransferase [Solirubrobacteraceae bacterium]|nr:protein-L-isoaspartate(D-aspartate) O-methyltransferase [Solirubrobacteraceae bacterium]